MKSLWVRLVQRVEAARFEQRADLIPEQAIVGLHRGHARQRHGVSRPVVRQPIADAPDRLVGIVVVDLDVLAADVGEGGVVA